MQNYTPTIIIIDGWGDFLCKNAIIALNTYSYFIIINVRYYFYYIYAYLHFFKICYNINQFK